jgi:hypothetical protein
MHRSTADLEAGLDHIRSSPIDDGTLELVLRRPAVDEREVLEVADLSIGEGVVGDTWNVRGSKRTADGSAHPDMALNVMNARAAALIAGPRERWPLAGDQLYVDLDLSAANLAPWTKLAIGTAIIEITDQPHLGCAKFTQRFGLDAHRFVNSEVGRALNLRGVNARVAQPGTVRPGDVITRC